MTKKYRVIIAIITTFFSYTSQCADLGFTPVGTNRFIKVCEGAYISNNQYVTAAHCLALLNALYFDVNISPSVEDGNEIYTILDFNISNKFRTRLDQNVHDDLAIVITENKENRQFLEVSNKPITTPELILSTPHFKSESGRVLLNKDGHIHGVLSRKYSKGGSVYTAINVDIINELLNK